MPLMLLVLMIVVIVMSVAGFRVRADELGRDHQFPVGWCELACVTTEK